MESSRLSSNDVITSRWVFRSNSLSFAVWQAILAFVIIFLLWVDSLTLVTEEWMQEGIFGQWCDFLAFAVLGAEILINFNTDFLGQQGKWITQRWLIARNYVTSWFFLDLCTLPWHLLVHSSTSNAGNSGAESIRMVKLLKMLKVLRMFKLLCSRSKLDLVFEHIDDIVATELSSPEGLDVVLDVLHVSACIVKFWVVLLVESHFTALILLWHCCDGDLVWRSNGDSVDNLDPMVRYMVAIRWCCTGLLTGASSERILEFVDMNTATERFQFLILMCFAANLVYALSLYANLKGYSEDSADFKRQFVSLKHYLRRSRNISKEVRRDVLRYHVALKRSTLTNVVHTMIEKLPTMTRKELNLALYGEFIDSLCLFSQGPLSDASIRDPFSLEVCFHLKNMCLALGSKVVVKGSRYDATCFVMSGRFQDEDDENSSIAKGLSNRITSPRTGISHRSLNMFSTMASVSGRIPAKASEFLGIECILAPDTPKYQMVGRTVVTMENCEFACLTRKAFQKVIEDFPSVVPFVEFVRSMIADGKLIVNDLTRVGLPESLQSRWQRLCELGATSEELGVSCRYIIRHFKQDVEDAFGEDDVAEFNFRDLSKMIWVPQDRGFKGCKESICPRDGAPGCAIVDSLDAVFKGKASHFVSWCWRYSTKTLISALRQYVIRHKVDEQKAFLWVCFFCNNQRKVLVQRSSCNVDLENVFGNRLTSIGTVVIVLDDYKQPEYTKRIWCVYELYIAEMGGISTHVALPEQSVASLKRELLVPGGLAEIAQKLTLISVEDAEASFQSDADMIKDKIKQTIGFATVNKAVKYALAHWLSESLQDYLTDGHP